MSAKGDKIVHRKSMAAGHADEPEAMERDETGADRGGKAAEKAAKAAAKAKAEAIKKKGMDQMLGLSIEEHKARANKRISEHARVQYFESVLLTDLKHAAHDLDLLLQANTKKPAGELFAPLLGCFGASAAQKKKAKTDRGIVNALKDVIKNSFRELQILQTATSHSNKHRSELERMVEALLEKQEEDDQAMKISGMGGLGMPGMMGVQGLGGGGGDGKKEKEAKKKNIGKVGFASMDADGDDGDGDGDDLDDL